MNSPADHYKGFMDLASAQVEGIDYRVHVRANAGSPVAVIAPHGGSIEQYTSDVARDIAGANFNLYLFEGIRQAGNYSALHLTSHRFDEPRCLELLSRCNLDGKIDQWYSLQGRTGVAFILNVSDLAVARDMLEKLPLGQAHLMSFELTPLGPLNPLRQLQGMAAGSP